MEERYDWHTAFYNAIRAELVDKKMSPMAADKWDTLFRELGRADNWEAEDPGNTLAIWRGIRRNVPPEQLAEETGWPIEKVEELRREFLSV